MKNVKQNLLIVTAMIAFVLNSNAQDTGSATSSATIITPISITKTVDMNFGNIATDGTTGTVVLPSVDGVRTKTGGATLPATAGTVAVATFTIQGEGTYTYAITLPTTDYVITHDTTASTMTVNGFESTPSGTGALTAGSQTLTVGATLNLGANQEAGSYTNATGFDVTVNYN